MLLEKLEKWNTFSNWALSSLEISKTKTKNREYINYYTKRHGKTIPSKKVYLLGQTLSKKVYLLGQKPSKKVYLLGQNSVPLGQNSVPFGAGDCRNTLTYSCLHCYVLLIIILIRDLNISNYYRTSHPKFWDFGVCFFLPCGSDHSGCVTSTFSSNGCVSNIDATLCGKLNKNRVTKWKI